MNTLNKLKIIIIRNLKNINLNKRSIINYLLLPFTIFYFFASFKRKFYQIGLRKTHNFNIPLIVIGNITVGGSGKTPIVIALTNFFKQQGRKVAVVSRGYGGKHKHGSLLVDENTKATLSGDEPLLIARETKAKVMVNKNRVQAVQDLIANFELDLIISDDGLQHYAMGRSIEIAVINGINRFGNGFFLPAGPLREPKSRLKTVDFIINSGGVALDKEIPSILKPKKFINLITGETKPLKKFNNKTCHAIAGIAQPHNFFTTLKKLKIHIITHSFTDHYIYNYNDLNFNDEHPVLMTAKDYVKCSEFATDKMWYLHTEASLNEQFLKKLNAKL